MATQSSSSSPSPPSVKVPPWDIIITEWALDSYLTLKHQSVFSDQDYWETLRPDVELLRDGLPSPHAKFNSHTFWGPAKQGSGILHGGYKMKWHNLGTGQVQLRLPVAVETNRTLLCEAYVKANVATEARKIARFKTHMNLISQGRFTYRGKL
jgi:hypothetical protein